jgi:hypothetical protein
VGRTPGMGRVLARVDLSPTPSADVLDAYESTACVVAESVLPSVASLQVRRPWRQGCGSARVLIAGGFLLNNAQLVDGRGVEAEFANGSAVRVDRCAST